MQYQMSGAPAPGLVPPVGPPAAAPKIVEPHRKAPKGRRWVFVLGLIVIAALAWWLWNRQAASNTQAGKGGASAPVIRTAAASTGTITRTLRLTGTTGAEKFASLLVPQMRGSRSESLREGKEFKGPNIDLNVASNGRSSGAVGGSNMASGVGSSGDGQVASTAGSGGGGSSAMRAATSRVSRGSASPSTSSRSGGSSASSGTSLGSTAGALLNFGGSGGGGGGGGGGFRGGGMSEFSLVLQETAKAGAFVKAGTVVAEFDRQYMMNRLEDYRASVAQMESSFNKMKKEVEVARRAQVLKVENQKAELDKAQLDLKTLPVMGQIDSERTKLTAEEAQAKYKQLLAEVKFVEAGYSSQIRNAELELKQAQLELKRAEANADRMLVKAPIGGLVVMQTTLRGTELAQIQAGDQLYPGMRFMQIVDPSSMVVNATVNQVDAESLRVGSKATVRFDAFPGLELPARIHAIGAMTRPGGFRASFVKDIPVLLKLDKLDPRVIPDLSVSVDVEIEREEQRATIVPLAAVFYGAGDEGSYVFIKKGDGWERRSVQLGVSDNLSVAVRSGLQAGEVVALDRPPEGIQKAAR